MILVPYRSHIIVGLICLITGLIGGLGIGWKLYHPELVIETPKAEKRLDEIGVVVLERLPETVAPVPEPIKKAAKKVGGKLERAATITVQPKAKEGSPADCECEDVKVSIGVVDEGDGKRIVTHAEDGTILGGTDIPLEPYSMDKSDKWEIGAIIPVEYPEGAGVYVSRKIGPFSLGVQAVQPSEQEGWTAMATVGWRF
jgi:hypothetical protein